MSKSSRLRRLRIRQIRIFASLLSLLGTRSSGSRLIVRARSLRWSRRALEWSLGYRRTFHSFVEAQACATKYINAGHEHPDEIRFHSSLSQSVRESDYPVLFHLAPLAADVRRVFDLGGNVGNLFYSYQRQICFSPDLVWTIYDLPVKKETALQLAADRGETRVRFTNDLNEVSGSDVLIASGSLHYFEGGIESILNGTESPPTHVFVNRTPLSKRADLITVQDNRSYLVPCKLHSSSRLLDSMKRLGYLLIAEWPVHERKLWVPLYPEASSQTYSGFYFRKQ